MKLLCSIIRFEQSESENFNISVVQFPAASVTPSTRPGTTTVEDLLESQKWESCSSSPESSVDPEATDVKKGTLV